jgi:MFS family permease
MTASMTFDGARMRRARVAVSLAFLAFGTELGLWFAHIPVVAKRLSLGPAQLGLGILSVGVIGLVVQPLTGVAITRFGSRRTTMLLLPAFVATETLLINAPSQRAFFMFTALVGLVVLPSNVGNNTMAAELERLYGRPVMSSFHGFFSVGGLVGSLLGGALIAADEGDGGGAIVVGVLLLLVSLWATVNSLEVAPERSAGGNRPRFAIPAAALLGLGVLAFCSNLIEGAVGDWSALYLATIKHADPALAASGYTLLSMAMAAVRFAGGPVVERLGRKTVVVVGGCLMAAGMIIVILAPWPLVSALGFLVVAVGASNLSPILTSAAANLPGVAPSIGIAALATSITLGLFVGPPAIGFIAQAWNLSLGFGVLALLGVIVAVGAALRRWAPAR